MTPGESHSAFREHMHMMYPEDLLSVTLRHDTPPTERALCGEHGRVVPTPANVCPQCAGYVMPMAEVERFRAVASALRLEGLI